MPILEKDTEAIFIHGKTGQAVEECVLEEGTEYEFMKTHRDSFGYIWQRINVDGYLYDIEQP